MNLRVYLRLLQPVPALLFTAIYANGAAAFGTLFFGLERADAYLLALLVAVPLLLGMDLASAAHAAMHRPFFPLLPDGARRLRRATIWTGLVCAAGLTVAAAWFFPDVPPPAVFGLAAALLVLPCLNRRRLVARSHVFHVSVNLAGLQFPVMGVAGWALFMRIGAHRLVPAIVAAPWLFFAGGLGTAAWLLRLGFSRDSLRERAGTPFLPINVVWGALWHPQVMVRHRDEARQQLLRPNSGHPPAAQAAGRDWTVTAVGPRTRDWLLVLWHASYGAMRRGSFLRAQGLIFLIMLGYAFALPAIGFMFALFEHRPFGFAGYLESLAALGSVDPGAVNSAAQAGSALVSLMLHLGFTFALVLASQLRPQLPYPVSRERLARVSFAHALIQLVFALAIPTGALQFASLTGQVAAGKFLPALGLPPLLLLDFVFIPVLLLVASVARLQRVATRIAALVVLAAAACALEVSRSMWSGLVLRPGGALGVTFATAFALQVLWWQTRRHYRRCDLLNEAAQAPAFGFGINVNLTRPPVSASAR